MQCIESTSGIRRGILTFSVNSLKKKTQYPEASSEACKTRPQNKFLDAWTCILLRIRIRLQALLTPDLDPSAIRMRIRKSVNDKHITRM
jgi:hypothetical protein